MTKLTLPSKEARARMITRPDGSTTTIRVRDTKSRAGLQYAIRFLMDYNLYQQSKGINGPSASTAMEVAAAVEEALADYNTEVVSRLNGTYQSNDDVVSRIGEGQVTNPFVFIKG